MSAPIVSVFIVEDEPVIAMLISEVVKSLGFLVCDIAVNEADAVKTALIRLPDLMIIDGHLREGSGVAAMETILQSLIMPCVFVTGDKRGISERIPGAVILEKPFFVPDLERAIAQALEGATIGASLPPEAARST